MRAADAQGMPAMPETTSGLSLSAIAGLPCNNAMNVRFADACAFGDHRFRIPSALKRPNSRYRFIGIFGPPVASAILTSAVQRLVGVVLLAAYPSEIG